MFRAPSPQNTPRGQAQTGQIVPLAIPAKGINARDSLALMGPDSAISLVNALCEPYGLRTRKGYTEFAKNVPPLAPPAPVPVYTVMVYYPAIANVAAVKKGVTARSVVSRMFSEIRLPKDTPIVPANAHLFAARGGFLYDVSAGGVGPWAAQAGVGGAAFSDFWTWINFQNIAGAFLIATNDNGGYAFYNGAVWTTPVAGAGAGQIDGVDPAKFCFVVEHKKRLWFIEKNSTKAWYLPVGQIAGLAKEFNFGEQFKHGGHLVALSAYTVDGGIGVDDYFIAVSSQGDVALYKGVDPADPNDWAITGVWSVGPLPVGRRSVLNTGADVYILSQFGVTPLSLLLKSAELGILDQKRLTYMIAPLVARLMRQYSALEGWQLYILPKEELFAVGVPREAQDFGGQYFVLKISTGGWSLIKGVPYASFASVDNQVVAGTFDGRVVRAFDGTLDNVLIGQVTGVPIQCQVTPSYQPLGSPGVQKQALLIRPTFICTATPTLKIQPMFDYGPPKPVVVPTLPEFDESRWDEGMWNEARWSGVQDPIHRWLGFHGVGFAATAQLDYLCGGDTVLASIDFWTKQGGVM